MLATLQFVYLTLSVGIGVMAVGDGNFHLYSAAYYATMNKCTVYIYIYICDIGHDVNYICISL